jgi:ribosome-associated protein
MAISAQRRVARTKALVQLEELVLAALADMKAVNVRVMDVRGLTDVADTMIIASGNSDRHVRSIADLVIERAKQAGRRPMGTEGKNDAEWVLVDLQDVLVHVMLPRVREFYALEELWEAPAAARAQEKTDKARPAKRKARAPGRGTTKSKAPAKGGRAVTAPRAKRAARPRPSRPRG